MTTLWNHPVTDLQPGDIWLTREVDIRIAAVETVDSDVPLTGGRIRIQGNITRGLGRSERLHAWHFTPTQTIDICR